MGRRISELEECLGSKLLHRHGHGVSLTKRGTELADRAMAMSSTAQQIDRFLVGRDQTLDGTVRLTATEGLITLWLMPQIAKFQQKFPLIRLEVVTASSWASLSTSNEDIALRSAAPGAKRVPAQKVAHTKFALYASPAYLGRVNQPADLRGSA